MAKSLKSRRQRKMRAVKRVRYGAKADAALKKVLEKGAKQLLEDEEMQELVKVTDAKKVVAETEAVKDGEEPMEDKEPKKYNPKTMRDENGHYPAWMTKKDQRVRQAKNKNKKVTKRGQGGKKGKKHW
ncbi:hypothetical protein CAPTEDRAFT_20770 [Capitella teleta]|uniref:Protein LLP homolog n=1 Tax=Capitella teleta TaxID=283909 RepID=R7TVE1_CAPTE|nr:hypothetical protein CAPTEDRAFT_20770 [Capitella teleta]|eukprot:ELT94985.1 hypothetical protein CAPTEDRAFT_20770 [Capitella teleta]